MIIPIFFALVKVPTRWTWRLLGNGFNWGKQPYISGAFPSLLLLLFLFTTFFFVLCISKLSILPLKRNFVCESSYFFLLSWMPCGGRGFWVYGLWYSFVLNCYCLIHLTFTFHFDLDTRNIVTLYFIWLGMW